MQRSYWDNLAGNFEDEIFSVFDNDSSGLIRAAIRKYGKRTQTATDIGCGTGSFLPVMSRQFKRVTAIDISPKVLKRARRNYADLENIDFRVENLAKEGQSLPAVDTSLCVNVLLTPSLGDRIRMLDSLCGHIKAKGHLVLVVPSLESAMLTHSRLIEWNVREGTSPGHAASARFGSLTKEEAHHLRAGIVHVDSVPHKHFLKEEICHSLEKRNMLVVEIEKIEYPWSSEFEDPPGWMQSPYPWDWLLIARKA